jgi:hypothetical protein
MGSWSAFTAGLIFNPGASATRTVVTLDHSAKDGSMIDVVNIPVQFSQQVDRVKPA